MRTVTSFRQHRDDADHYRYVLVVTNLPISGQVHELAPSSHTGSSTRWCFARVQRLPMTIRSAFKFSPTRSAWL